MTTNDTLNPVRELWVPQLLMGIVALVLGVLVLFWPGISIVVASVLLGIYLVVSGIAQIIMAFGMEVSGGYRVLLFITGALSLVLGVLAFRHFGQGYAVLLLAIWIGVGFVFQGVAAIAIAISNSELPGRGWAILFGVLSAIAGVVVLAWPFGSLGVLALVTGIMLVLIGLTEIFSSFGTRNDLRKTEKRLSRLAPPAPHRAA